MTGKPSLLTNPMTSQFYLNIDSDVSNSGSSGSLIIGNKSGDSIGIDGNEIIARNGNSASTLYLQNEGGTIETHANVFIFDDRDVGTSWNSGNLIIGGTSASIGIDSNEIMARQGNSAGTLYLQAEGGSLQVGCSATFSGAVYSNSDRHLKKHIHSIDKLSLNDLFDISDKLIKTFKWKSSNKDSYGFIAQELERYIPEAISSDAEGIKTVDYNTAIIKILAAVINEIKQNKK